MIVKKLYSRYRFKGWDKENARFDKITTIDCLGYFLFGFIPIYLEVLDKHVELFGEEEFRVRAYEKFGELI